LREYRLLFTTLTRLLKSNTITDQQIGKMYIGKTHIYQTGSNVY